MPSWETFVVAGIVTVALVWAVRASWRSVRSGSVCSDCADSGSCPLANDPTLLKKLAEDPSAVAPECCGAVGTSRVCSHPEVVEPGKKARPS